MRRVNSEALVLVQRALGISGVSVGGVTEFLDEQLDQTVDVGRLIRRGRTQAGTGGLYYGLLENVHGAGNTQESLIAPYLTPTGSNPPYPSPMLASFDIWVLGAHVSRLSGTGTFTGALFIIPTATVQGWGIDESAVAVAAAVPSTPLAFWDSVVTQTRTFAIKEDGQPFQRIGLRLIRGARNATQLRFSSTSSAVSTYRCHVLLGVFPIGLEQDGII